MRQHLAECLEKCRLSRFPAVCERRTVGVRHTQSVGLHCSCRLPKEIGDKNLMAECDVIPGTTNTAWTFLTMFLKKKRMSPGSVNQCETLPSILLYYSIPRCGHMY